MTPASSSVALNQIYQIAYESVPGNQPDDVRARKATETLAQAVVDNFGFVPDHYVTVKGEPFIELVDTLDGIEVDVQQDILDVPLGWSTFYSGTQTLDGQQTLDYVRILLPADTPLESLWERFDRQNQVLQALLVASLKTENWSELPELVKLVRKILVTDLSTNQADDLACMVERYGSEAEQVELPPETVTIDEHGRLIPDLPAIQDLIKNLGQTE